MSDKKIEIRIPGDDDGYVELACPACDGRFKLSAADMNEWDASSVWCPICGMCDDTAAYLPPEVGDIAQRHAENIATDLLNDFRKNLERAFRGNKHISFKKGKPLRKKPIPEVRQHVDFSFVEFDCCGIAAKVSDDVAVTASYCPSCGEVKT